MITIKQIMLIMIITNNLHAGGGEGPGGFHALPVSLFCLHVMFHSIIIVAIC